MREFGLFHRGQILFFQSVRPRTLVIQTVFLPAFLGTISVKAKFLSETSSDGIRTGSGSEKVRVIKKTGNPSNSNQKPDPKRTLITAYWRLN